MVGLQQVLAALRVDRRLERAISPNNRKSSTQAYTTFAMPVFYNICAVFYHTIKRDNTTKYHKHLAISVVVRHCPVKT